MAAVLHGNVQTMQAQLDLIAQQIDRSMKQPLNNGRHIRDLAVEIVQGCPEHGILSEHCQISRVFHWVKANVAYRHDPVDYDLFMSAKRTIESRGADCDDHCVLTCSLLSSIGFRTGAKVVSPDGSAWHIYAVAVTRSHLPPHSPITVALDTTQSESYPGWEPAMVHRKHEYVAVFQDGRAQYKRVR